MVLALVSSLTSFLYSLLHSSSSALTSFIGGYGYYALFALMMLESASLPIPSEIVLPLAGLFAAQGKLNFWIAFAVAFAAGIVGITIDYLIAYILGKDVVYKHLSLFHIKKESIDSFDKWFNENGPFAVFVCRLLPEVRGLINFPAGFALMDKKKFYLYSFAGMLLWNIILMSFGYYTTSIKNPYEIVAYFAAFAIALTVVYVVATRRIRKR